jgi:hypothetical protein
LIDFSQNEVLIDDLKKFQKKISQNQNLQETINFPLQRLIHNLSKLENPFKLQSHYTKEKISKFQQRISTLSNLSSDQSLSEVQDLEIEMNILKEETRIQLAPQTIPQRIHEEIPILEETNSRIPLILTEDHKERKNPWEIIKIICENFNQEISAPVFHSEMNSIIIHPSVKSISENCFKSFSKLTTIIIPSSITSLCDNSFESCTNLTGIFLPKSITFIGKDCFFGCSKLVNLIIPPSIKSIPDSCFCTCLSLTTINLPDSITSLGNNCFTGCSALKEINLPKSITFIGYYNFLNALI